MNWSFILQLIVGIPKLAEVVISIIKAVRNFQLEAQKRALTEAVLKAQNAKNLQDAETASKDIASNMP
jgi:hypothetical protein